MNIKQKARIRRAKRSRGKIKDISAVRMSVYRTPRHIYAQVFSACGSKVLAAASSVEKCVREQTIEGGKTGVAEAVGKLVAERAVKAGVDKVAFDRSGYRFHGRIKALAEAARSNGLAC